LDIYPYNIYIFRFFKKAWFKRHFDGTHDETNLDFWQAENEQAFCLNSIDNVKMLKVSKLACN
jgi:hypothetical protein